MQSNSPSRNEQARAAIFDAITGALAESRPFDIEYAHRHHGADPAVLITLEEKTDDLIDLFQRTVEAVGASCSIVQSKREIPTALVPLLPPDAKIAISDSPLVAEVVSAAGFPQVIDSSSVPPLFDSDAGITEAQWGIAETGTLVLEAGAERNRIVSLVPPVHVCLLRADTIRRTMGEILAITKQRLSRTVTFITGASRTSDIELTLAIGVHGPGELNVIVYLDSE